MLTNSNAKAKIHLRPSWVNKSISIEVLLTSNLFYIKRFLKFYYKKEIQSIESIKLIYLGTLLSENDDSKPISTIITNNPKPEFYISLKPIQVNERHITLQKELDSKPKGVLFEMKEFQFVENRNFDDYVNALSFNSLSLLNTLPLFSLNLKMRSQNFYESQDGVDEIDIAENYPMKGYFQLGLFFRLILTLLFFGFGMKTFSFSLFISGLIIYYWYTVIADISNYYDNKISEVKFNDKEGGMLDGDLLQYLTKKDEEERNEEKKEKKKEKEEGDILIENEEFEMNNKKKVVDDEKEEKNEEIYKNINENMKLDDRNTIEDTKRNTIHEDLNKNPHQTSTEKPEEHSLFSIRSVCLILKTFLFSMIPPWSEEFERNNPIIQPIQTEAEIKQDVKQDEKIESTLKNEINLENEQNKQSLLTDLDEVDHQKKEKKTISETKRVNLDINSNLKRFNLINEENFDEASREFVFSDNVVIENISYQNESIQEMMLKRKAFEEKDLKERVKEKEE